MHLSKGWPPYLFILATFIPVEGKNRVNDCSMPPFICQRIPKVHFESTYPGWKLIGSYDDLVYAFDRAMEMSSVLTGNGSSVTLESRYPNVTTWKDWVDFSKEQILEKSQTNYSLTNRAQADIKDAALWLITLTQDESKYLNSIHYSFPDSTILLVMKSNNFLLHTLNDHPSSIVDETFNKIFSETESGADQPISLETEQEEISLLDPFIPPKESTPGHNKISKTEHEERQVILQPNNIFRKASNLDYFKLKLRLSEQSFDQKRGYDQKFQNSFKHPPPMFQKRDEKPIRLKLFKRVQKEKLTVRKKPDTLQAEQPGQIHWNYSEQSIIPKYSAISKNGEVSYLKIKKFKNRFKVSQHETDMPHLKGSSEEGYSNSASNDEEGTGDSTLERALPPLRSDDPYFERNCKIFLASLQVDEEKQKEIFDATIEQAESKRWHKERKYRLTASCFGIVYNWTESKLRLIYRILYSFPRNITSGDKLAALDWGRKNEHAAARDYERANNVKIERSGLIVDLKRGYLAASPDGLIGNDTVCEIKCPYFLRNAVPSGVLKSEELYCCTYDFEKGEARLRRDHYYYYQMQGQMAISGRKKGVFILWSPRGLLSETIDFDPELWDRLVKVLENFYKKYLVPEYLYNYHRYETQYGDNS